MPDKNIIRMTPHPDGFGDRPDPLDAGEFVSALPVQHSHECYSDEELGLYVGLWDTSDMVEVPGPYPMEEFMYLLQGEARIKNNRTGAVESVNAGEAFIIPRGYDCQWRQLGYLRKYFVIYENPDEGIPAQPVLEGVAIPRAGDASEEMQGETPFLIKGDAVQMANHCYVNHSGSFRAGTWECANFESGLRPFPYHLFACVKEGVLILNDESGEAHAFNTGDAFFLPQGVVCSARSDARVRLLFCAIIPK